MIQMTLCFFAFIRVNALLSFIPFFGDQPIPLRFRSALSAVIALWILPTLSEVVVPKEINSVYGLLLLVVGEILLGICVGYISKLCLDAIVAASTLVATQMGFGADKLFIPDYSGELDSFTAFHRMIILLVFLALNLHYGFLITISKSFELIPLFRVQINTQIVGLIVDYSADIFKISIQLATPILVGILLSTTALGILSRTVPQLNVFVVSYGINFVLGMLVYLATLAMFPDWLIVEYDKTMESIQTILLSLKSGA
jgi:flagellar biosynthetic protein FliR